MESAAAACARAANDMTEVRRRKSLVVAEAADAGKEQAQIQDSAHRQRRMSSIAKEAADAAGDGEDTEEGGGKNPHDDAPEWQLQTRRKGSVIAGEAAGVILMKSETRRRGSSVANEASKHAILKGIANH